MKKILICLVMVLCMVGSANAVVMGGWTSQFGYNGQTAYFECYNVAWSGRPADFTIVVKHFTYDINGRLTEWLARGITYEWSDLNKSYVITWTLPMPVTYANTAVQIGCWMNGKLVYYTQWVINNGRVSLFKSGQ